MDKKDYLSCGLGVQGNGVVCGVLLLKLGCCVGVVSGGGDQ